MPIRVLVLLVLSLALVACSGGPKNKDATVFTQGPIQATDAKAQARFDQSVALLETGEFAGGAEELRLLQADYPNDPISQVAELYLARASVGEWDVALSASTRSIFAGLTADTKVDGRIRYAALLYHAAALVSSDRQAALTMLSDYPGQTLSPAVLRRDRVMGWALLAEARTQDNNHVSAIVVFANGFTDVEGLPKAEDFRDHARARAFVLGESASDDALGALITESKSQFARAVAGWTLIQRGSTSVSRERLIAELIGIGAPEKAAQIRRDSDPADTEGRPVIGLVAPLSGPQSTLGNRARNAGLLAVDALEPTAHGAVTLAFIDSNRSVDEITQELESLEINVFVGPLDNTKAKDLATWAASENVLMVAPVATLPESFEDSWSFRNFISPELETRAIAKAVQDVGDTSVVILYPSIGYGERMRKEFAQSLTTQAPEVKLHEISYDRASNDFTTVANRVAKLKPHAIFIPDTASKVAQVTAFLAQKNLWGIPLAQARNARSKRVEVHYLGTSLWQHPDLIRQAATYISGATIPAWQSTAFRDEESRNFHDGFMQAFGAPGGDIEAFVYDSVRMIRKPMESHSLYGAVELRETILGQEAYHGATGHVRFAPNGEPAREVRFITVKDGKFAELLPGSK